MMRSILTLFELRDKYYQEAYNNRNRDHYKRNYFLNSAESDAVLNYVAETFEDTILENALDLDSINKIFLIIEKESTWTMVVLDISAKSLYYVDGTASYDMPDVVECMRGIRQKLNVFLARYMANPNWTLKPYPYRYNVDGLVDNRDSGLYILSFLFNAVSSCPVVFTYDDVCKFSIYLCVWILNKKLPY